MNPDLDIWPVEKKIKAARVICVKVANDDFFHVFNPIPSCCDGNFKPILWLILNARKDVIDHWSTVDWVVIPGTRFPENESLMRVFNEDTIHR
jgi:hypothetical protein